MFRELFVVSAVFVVTVEATAQTTITKNNCFEISNDLDRLACYDKQSGRTPTAIALPSKSEWQITSEKSALTDQTTVVLRLPSQNPISCRFKLQGHRVALVVRCLENTTSLFFSTECHMSASKYDDSGHVDYRIDKLKARKWRMENSTNNRALGLWSGGRSIKSIKSMFGKKLLTARMRPYSESQFTVTYNITGLATAIKPLRTACGW